MSLLNCTFPKRLQTYPNMEESSKALLSRTECFLIHYLSLIIRLGSRQSPEKAICNRNGRLPRLGYFFLSLFCLLVKYLLSQLKVVLLMSALDPELLLD